jgi:cob(I)alamin adenosyltransferase
MPLEQYNQKDLSTELEKIDRELYSSNGDLAPTPITTEDEKDNKIKELEKKVKELEDHILSYK